MKELIFLLAIVLLLIPFANAVTVTLDSPDGTVLTTSTVTFRCTINGNNISLSSALLYFGNESTWHLNKTIEASGTSFQAEFVIGNIPNGNYLWNCMGQDETNTNALAAVNKTFSVNVVAVAPVINNPPTLVAEIPSRKWHQDENITIILNDYFDDSDDDKLIFTVRGNSKIAITIQDGFVKLVPEAGWIGTERVIFTASDGNGTIDSNEVLLNVTARNGKQNKPPEITGHSPMESTYTINNGEQAFSINASDPEKSTLTYVWKMDGKIVGNDATYTVKNAASGNHVLVAEISDGLENGNFTWAITVKASATSKSAPKVETTQKVVCGDGKKDATENCENCLKDAPCESGYSCVKGGRCQKRSVLPLISAIIFSMMAFLTGGYFAYEYLLKDKIAKLLHKDSDDAPKEAESIKQAVQSSPQEIKQSNFKPLVEAPEKKVVTQQQSKLASRKEDALQDYVLKMLGKGHSQQEISNNLLKAGWSKEKIEEAFRLAKLNKQYKSGVA